MEQFVDLFLKDDDRIYAELPDIQFKNYGFSGNKSLGLIWIKYQKIIIFLEKK